MYIKIKKLTETAITPTRGSEYAAGYDLYADISADGEGRYITLDGQRFASISKHETLKIPTGIALQIPEGYFGGVYARSGLSTKENLRPANCVGVIDSDYRGEVIVPLHNDADSKRNILDGERIAQLIIQPFVTAEFNEVNELKNTERGDGGFGSSDNNKGGEV